MRTKKNTTPKPDVYLQPQERFGPLPPLECQDSSDGAEIRPGDYVSLKGGYHIVLKKYIQTDDEPAKGERKGRRVFFTVYGFLGEYAVIGSGFHKAIVPRKILKKIWLREHQKRI